MLMIYPIPQKYNLNGENVEIGAVKLSGEFEIIASKVFADCQIPLDGTFNVIFKYVNSKRTTYAEDICCLTDEKYIINIKEDEILVECSCEKSAFRGAHTVAKLISKGEVKQGVIEDYPLFKKRGYIEGFYGPIWENEKRISVIKLMASYGMNTFFYAPKDDVYHRAKWNEPYPEKELRELSELFALACENQMDFYWCIGPGLSYKYTSDGDFTLLIEKIKSIYNIGVRNFGLLLDDIPWDFQYEEDREVFDSIADAHIFLVNKTYEALKELDSTVSLTVCPTQYSGDANGYYISKFGTAVPADVDIFWTGAEICSRVLTVREADELTYFMKHKPLYWDNYPVNDCEMFQEMHLGAIRGRDKELYSHCEGIISNVMEYAECSKIPLLTFADYLWNPIKYSPDNSLRNAHRQILGENAELFSYFADHLGVSCLSRYTSPLMSKTLSHIAFLESRGKKDEALEELSDYIKNMRSCLQLVSDESVPLFKELRKWVKKFSMCCDLLDAIYCAKISPTEESKGKLSSLLEKYNSDAVMLTGFCLKEAAERTLSAKYY